VAVENATVPPPVVVAAAVAGVVAAVGAAATLSDGGGGRCHAPAVAVVALPEEDLAAAPVPAAAPRRRPWATRWVLPETAVMAATAVADVGTTAVAAAATLRGMPPPACSRAFQFHLCRGAMPLSGSDGYGDGSAGKTTGRMDGARCR